MMGIKKLSWKKIGTGLFIIAAIITILTNLKTVWNYLEFSGNLVEKIFSPLANPIVRDVFLFALFVGLLIWLILVNRKVRNISQAEKSELKKEWKFEWNRRHDYVLERIVEADREVAIGSLFEGYKENFPGDSEKKYKLIVFDLEESNLIRSTGYAGKDKLYVRTDDGRRRYMKGIRRRYKKKEEEPKKEEKKLTLTDEQIFVLALIVELEEEASDRLLSVFLKKQFPDAYVVDFKSTIGWLERNGLIRLTGSIGGHSLYVAEDKGIECALREKDMIKKYQKEIDEFKEMSKKMEDF